MTFLTTSRDARRSRTAAVALAAAAAALFLLPAIARAEAPWQQATTVQDKLFEAQTDILLEGGASAAADVDAAEAAVTGRLEKQLAASSPAMLRELRAGARGRRVGRGNRATRWPSQRPAGGRWRRSATAPSTSRSRRPCEGEVERARDWLLIRDFRQATRFTRPGVDATTSLDQLEAGEIPPQDAVTGVRKDLLDAYQARLVTYLDEAEQAAERGFDAALAENAALAAGYWAVLAPEYEEQRSPAERKAEDANFAALAAAAAAGDRRAFRRSRERALDALNGFTAAPFTPEEQVRRANQLTRFLDLIPVEYDHGTDDGESRSRSRSRSRSPSPRAPAQPSTTSSPSFRSATPRASRPCSRLLTRSTASTPTQTRAARSLRSTRSRRLHDEASDALDGMFPEEWKESDTEADFDLAAISLDQMEAAVNAGEREQAEQARLSAYAFFEFGPERFLNSLDPQLVAEVEGLIWYGARGQSGLAELIANDGSAREIRETRLTLDEALEEAREITGEGASGVTVITNAALIVFREGLEAILIIAAIMASMVGANRRLREPIARGALLALPASGLLFLVSVLVLDELSQYGEKLEAIVGWSPSGCCYWCSTGSSTASTGPSGSPATASAARLSPARRRAGPWPARPCFGLYVLGFTSVFREGFETVLFLQALQLEAGTGIVLAGVTLGLVGVAAVGAITFKLEQRLPYKKMLVVTGVLIALVLVVMVGNTARTLQGVGWLSITPIDVELPLWMGTWLGVFPTWETIGAQAAAFGFVVGSYFLAEWVRKRQVRKAVDSPRSGGHGRARHGERKRTLPRPARRRHRPLQGPAAARSRARAGQPPLGIPVS